MLTAIDDWEFAVHMMKNGIDQRSINQINCMTQLDRDMDDALLENYENQ